MSAHDLLDQLRALGAAVAVSGDRLRITAPEELPPALLNALREAKAEILALLNPREPSRRTGRRGRWPETISGHPRQVGSSERCAFCGAGTWACYAGLPVCEECACHQDVAVWFRYQSALNAWADLVGGPADDLLAREVHQQLLKLIDEVGEPRATQLRRRWAREWQQAQGRCAWCGSVHELEEE